MDTPPEQPTGHGPFFVAIGASGSEGLADIKDLLRALEPALPAVILIVLHRPSDAVSYLRDVLATSTTWPVHVAEEDERFRVGHCYIGDPDAHLSLAARSRVHLVEGADHKHRGRTVDILFRSLAEHAKTRAIGVVLSGSLDDGSRGLAAIHHAGGVTMILTSEGLIESGMPINAAHFNGPIDAYGSAGELASEIRRRLEVAVAEST
jgi:two-component system, chemotaxis family, protein-glutamate methylesterase/glutaminase